MKSKLTGKGLSVGDLIANVYNACGKRRANGMLQLAFKAQVVVLREPNRCVISGGSRRS